MGSETYVLTWLYNSTALFPTDMVNTRGYSEAVVGFTVILGTLSQTKRASRANERKPRQLYREETRPATIRHQHQEIVEVMICLDKYDQTM